MWKRLSEAIRNVGKRSIPTIVHHDSAVITPTITATSKIVDVSKQTAEQHLKETMRVLSQSRASSEDNTAQLLALSKSPLSELTEDQLDDLGTAYYSGTTELGHSFERSAEVWGEASKRGSVFARYNRANLMRDGLGMPRNPAAAFKEYADIVNTTGLPLAHVS